MPSKFLNLCEELSPTNSSDPKWELIDFLKSKGVNVSGIRDTDMLYIDTGGKTIAINVSNNEEEAESVNAGFGNYDIDKEVEGLGAKAHSGLTGMAGKLFGTSAQQAKAAMKERQQVASQAVGAYKSATQRIKKGVEQSKKLQHTPNITI